MPVIVVTPYSVSGVVDLPPTVSITSPTNGSYVTAGDNLVVSATASDDISVSQVEFFAGNSGVLYPTAILNDSPTAYYKMDETSGTTITDSSGNGYDGTISSVGTGSYGLGAVALVDDNTTSIQFNNVGTSGNGAKVLGPSLGAMTFPVTLEAWIYIDSWNNTTFPVIVTHHNQDVGYYGFTLSVNSTGNVRPGYGFGGGFGAANCRFYTSANGVISLGTPYHVVVIFQDSTNATSYVNGVEYSLTNDFGTATSVNTSAGILALGIRDTGAGAGTEYYADGRIDHAAVYETALSATTVQQHYDIGIGTGTISLGVDVSAPYSVTWNSIPVGNFDLTAVATDSGAQETTSAIVNITSVADAYESTVQVDTPLLYWRLGEDTGTTMVDSSGNGYNGTVSGAYTLNQTGLVEQTTDGALLLSSSAQGVAAAVTGPSLGTLTFPVTLECWYEPTDLDGTPSTFPLISTHFEENDYNGFNLYAHYTAGITAMVGGGSGVIDTANRKNFSYAYTFSLSTVYHIVAVFTDINTFDVYVNGVQLSSPTISGTWASQPATSVGVVTLGTFDSSGAGGNNWYGVGKYDEAAIYASALSPARIAAHYAAGYNSPPTVSITSPINGAATSVGNDVTIQATASDTDGTVTQVEFFYANNYDSTVLADSPILYWRLGEDSGTTIADSSGNAYNGTVSGTYTLNQTSIVENATDGGLLLNSPAQGSDASVAGPSLGTLNFPVTLEIWWEPTDLVTLSTIPLISTHYEDNDYNGFNLFVATSGSVSAMVGAGTGTIGPANRKDYNVTGLTWNLGQTYHIVAVFTSISDFKIYINGALQSGSFGDGTAVSVSSVGVPAVGRFDNSSSPANTWFGKGIYDEAAIYDSALTLTQIQTHYGMGSNANGVSIGTDVSSPYTTTWTTPIEGVYSLTAVATDNGGKSTTSTAVTHTVTSETYTVEILSDSPVGYWRLGEDSGTTMFDSSGNSWDGTYVNTPTLNQTGLVSNTTDGSVLFVSAGSEYGIASIGTFNSAADWSVECWVQPTDLATNRQLLGFEGPGVAPSDDRIGLLIQTNGSLRIYYYQSGGVWTTVDTPASVITAAAVNHVVVTHSANILEFFVNGVSVYTTPGTINNVDWNGTTNFYIGTNVNNLGSFPSYTNGYVDEAAVYASALDIGTIQSHYFAGGGSIIDSYSTEIAADAPTVYYRVNESSGLTAYDYMSNYNGVYTGSGIGYSSPSLPTSITDTCVDLTTNGDYIDGGSIGSVTFPYSLEAWINLDTVASASIIHTHYDVTAYRGFSLYTDGTGKLVAAYGDGGGTASSNQKTWTMATALSTATTYHIVARFIDASTVQLFVNGIQQATTTGGTGSTLDASAGTLRVGYTNFNTAHQLLDGRIDEIAIYPDSLTYTEIQSHYTIGGGTINVTTLSDGVTLVGESVILNGWEYYQIEMPANTTAVEIGITSLTADVDLHVRKGALPNLSDFDCRPYEGGTTSETCNQSALPGEIWYAGVNGYQAGSYNIVANLTLGTDAYETEVLTESPLLYYRLGENSGTTIADSSGNAYNGTVSGTYTLNQTKIVDGTTDGALLLSSSGQGNAAAVTGPSLGAMTFPVTLETWWQPSSLPGGGFIPLVSTHHISNSYAGFFMYAGNDGNTLVAGFGNNGGTLSTDFKRWTYNPGSTVFTVGVTYHIVAVFTSTSQVTLYIDGVELRSSVTTSGSAVSVNTSVGTAAIGRLPTSTTDWYGVGKYDESAIYATGLTHTQILQHYNLGATDTLGLYSADTLSFGPLVYYELDETTGTTMADSSGNSWDGTYVNTPTLNQTALVVNTSGTSVLFESANSEYGQSTGVTGFNSANAWTIEAWFKPTDLAANRSIVQLADETAGDQHAVGLMSMTDGSVRLWWYAASETFTFNATNTGVIVPGETYHIVGTHDGSTNIEIYINGVASNVGTGTITAVNWSAATSVNVGVLENSSDALAQYQNGTIDEVAVFTTELTATNILNRYDLGKVVITTYRDLVLGDSPIAYYQLGENEGPTLYDSSGNNYHLTAQGTNTFSAGNLVLSSVANDGAFSSTNGGFPATDAAGARTTTNVLSSLAFPVTLEAWINLTDLSYIQPIIATHSDATHYKGFRMWVATDGSIAAIYGDGINGFGSTGRGGATTGAGVYTISTTSHIVAVFNAIGDVDIWVNGAKQVTSAYGTAASVSVSSGTLGVGNAIYSLSGGATLTGTIDEAAVYDVALTPTEIRDHYTTGSGITFDSYETQILNQSPKGYWRLGEDSGTTLADSSGNGYHATAGGTYTLNQAAIAGNTTDGSLLINNGYGDLSGAPLGTGNIGTFTIEAWVTLLTAPTLEAPSGGAIIYDQRTAPTNTNICLHIDPDRKVNAQIYPNTAATTVAGANFESNTQLAIGLPYHIVYKQNGSNRWIYINGQLDKMDSNPLTFNATISAAAIGDLASSHGGNSHMILDEVAVYDTALSEATIQANAAAGNVASYYGLEEIILPDSPLAYYKLDEASGTTMVDSSGNANNGTYINTPTLGATSLVNGGTNAVTFTRTNSEYGSASIGTVNTANAWTMEAWVNVPSFVANYGLMGIADDSSLNNNFHIELMTDGRINLSYYTGVYGAVYALGVFPITVGETHHVVVTHDGANTIKAYVDGAEIPMTSSDISAAIDWNGSTTAYVGAYETISTGTVTGFIDGTVDEAVFYTTALSAEDVAKRWEAGITPDYYYTVVREDNPKAYWRLGENTGTFAYDSNPSDTKYPLTYNTGYTLNVADVATANTDGAVQLTTSGVIERTAGIGTLAFPITVEAWVKWSGSPNSTDIFISHHDAAAYRGVKLYVSGTGRLRARIGDGGGVTSADRKDWQGATTLVSGTEYHVVVVFTDLNTCAIYINGASDSASFVDGTGSSFNTSSGTVRIGNSVQNAVSFVDEVAVYTRALSGSEILDHYNAGFIPPAEIVIVGANSGFFSGGNFARTTDTGATWGSAVTVGSSNALCSIVKKGSRLLAQTYTNPGTSDGFFYSDNDGASWTRVGNAGATVPNANGDLSNSLMVTSSNNFLVHDTVADTSWTSSDGITWTQGGSTFSLIGDGNVYDRIEFSSTIYLFCLGNSSTTKYSIIKTTNQGSSWSSVTGSAVNHSDQRVAASGTAVVWSCNDGVSTGYVIYRSTTMASYPGSFQHEISATLGNENILSMSYGNGTFVASVDREGVAYSTDDGVSWTEVSIPAFQNEGMAIKFCPTESVFVAVGMGNPTGGHGRTFYSYDGINWTQTSNHTMGGGIYRDSGVLGL